MIYIFIRYYSYISFVKDLPDVENTQSEVHLYEMYKKIDKRAIPV